MALLPPFRWTLHPGAPTPALRIANRSGVVGAGLAPRSPLAGMGIAGRGGQLVAGATGGAPAGLLVHTGEGAWRGRTGTELALVPPPRVGRVLGG